MDLSTGKQLHEGVFIDTVSTSSQFIILASHALQDSPYFIKFDGQVQLSYCLSFLYWNHVYCEVDRERLALVSSD